MTSLLFLKQGDVVLFKNRHHAIVYRNGMVTHIEYASSVKRLWLFNRDNLVHAGTKATYIYN